MPALVLVGAQWGDEGKGKATDLLGDQHRLLSCGSTAATTPATPSSSATRSTRCTCCPAASSRRAARRSSATASSSTWRCSSARSTCSRRAASTPSDCWSAPTPTSSPVPPHVDKVGERFLGKAQDRHDRARHRPDVRRQDVARRHPGAGPVRREDPAAEDRGGSGAEEPAAGQDLQPARDRPSTRSSRSCCSLRRAAAAVRRRHRRWC